MGEPTLGADIHPPTHGEVYYRIGTQVHDHEARIRLLERDTVMLMESTKRLADSVGSIQTALEKSQAQTGEKLDALQVQTSERIDRSQAQTAEKLDQISDRLTDHVVADGNSLRRLFSSSLVQFLVVISGVLYLIFEGKFNG